MYGKLRMPIMEKNAMLAASITTVPNLSHFSINSEPAMTSP
jgi:hypothetical protein